MTAFQGFAVWRGGMTAAAPRSAPLTVCKQTVAGQRNRTIKEATVKRYHYDTHAQLRRHLDRNRPVGTAF